MAILSGYFVNNLSYNLSIDDKNTFSFLGGFQYLDDLYRFTYAKAFDGPNDLFCAVNFQK